MNMSGMSVIEQDLRNRLRVADHCGNTSIEVAVQLVRDVLEELVAARLNNLCRCCGDALSQDPPPICALCTIKGTEHSDGTKCPGDK